MTVYLTCGDITRDITRENIREITRDITRDTCGGGWLGGRFVTNILTMVVSSCALLSEVSETARWVTEFNVSGAYSCSSTDNNYYLNKR